MQHSLEESVKEVKAIGAGLIRWLLTPTLAMMLRVPDTLSARFDFGTLSRGNCSLVWPTALVTLLIAFICVRSSVWTRYSAYSYFEVVTICNLIMILVFYLVHLFRLYRVLTCISWPLSELLHYLIGTLLLLIASIVAASKSYSQSGLVAGAVRTVSGDTSRTSSPLVHFLPDGQRRDCFPGPFFPRKVPVSTRLDPASSSLQRALNLGPQQRVSAGGPSGLLAHTDGPWPSPLSHKATA
ncbi:cklf-like marvel transmembrane [Lynx pardinus]|uniref:Cklf-like marvel transmembrane n=1 Tax=Lynx pardinus TaxID=191816 RepID=A0A485NWR2_LYNPA|nr:cklf-like marvel transmembrane [Lynx pardinus]